MTAKIAFTTLGCKTNQYDTDVMVGACRGMGLEIVSFDDVADVYVINTCTVTHSTDIQAGNTVRRAVRRNAAARVIVCGCGAQIDPERFKAIEGVSNVLGVRAVEELLPLLCKERRGEVGHDVPRLSALYKGEENARQSRARAYLKIQDGCDNRCSYCIVPFARGPSTSVPVEHVVHESMEFEMLGWREIILTGVHIGRYGRDLKPSVSLCDLISRILDQTHNCRIRLSSLDPDEIGHDLIALFSNQRICRHLHLSLQSGSDEVLTMMNRAPHIKQYSQFVTSLPSRIPGIAIGADIIAGFPGETDDHFEQTRSFVESHPFAYLHIFPYSKRPGTKAAEMPGQVPHKIIRGRAACLLKISKAKRNAFYERHIGETLDAVIVSKKRDASGTSKGVTDNYIPVHVTGSKHTYREISHVGITHVDQGRVCGRDA